MKHLVLVFFMSLWVSANTLHVAPNLALYQMPQKLSQSIQWHADTKLSASALGLWLLTANNLYRLDKPSKTLMTPLHVNSFSIAQSGHPILISDRHLGLVRHGLFLPSLSLPQSGFELASCTNDTLYLYNRKIPSPIYAFDGKMITPIAQPNQAVQALISLHQTLIFATKEGIFSLESGKPLELLIPLPPSIIVRSLAINPLSAEIFVSTEDTIFSLQDGIMTPLVTGVGGSLTYYDNCLWIADAKQQQLYIILPQSH